MLGALDNPQLSVRTIHEPLDLFLGIGHRIHLIRGALQPQDRAAHPVEPGVQAVTVSYAQGTAQVRFDAQKSPAAQVEKAINGTGYQIVTRN